MAQNCPLLGFKSEKIYQANIAVGSAGDHAIFTAESSQIVVLRYRLTANAETEVYWKDSDGTELDHGAAAPLTIGNGLAGVDVSTKGDPGNGGCPPIIVPEGKGLVLNTTGAVGGSIWYIKV